MDICYDQGGKYLFSKFSNFYTFLDNFNKLCENISCSISREICHHLDYSNALGLIYFAGWIFLRSLSTYIIMSFQNCFNTWVTAIKIKWGLMQTRKQIFQLNVGIGINFKEGFTIEKQNSTKISINYSHRIESLQSQTHPVMYDLNDFS